MPYKIWNNRVWPRILSFVVSKNLITYHFFRLDTDLHLESRFILINSHFQEYLSRPKLICRVAGISIFPFILATLIHNGLSKWLEFEKQSACFTSIQHHLSDPACRHLIRSMVRWQYTWCGRVPKIVFTYLLFLLVRFPVWLWTSAKLVPMLPLMVWIID